MLTRLCFTSLLLLFCTFLSAQSQAGGTPIGLDPVFASLFGDSPSPELVLGPNPAQLAEWERNHPGNTRFAAPVPVNYTLTEDGHWYELPDGGRVWQLRLHSPHARGLAVFYKNMRLPKGGRLYAYTPDGKTVLGAYTAENNPRSGRFLTGFTPGQWVTLEYYEPKAVRGQGQFEIFRLDYAYKKDDAGIVPDRSPSMFGFGTSLACNVNINCAEGDDWQAQKGSVCRIIVVLEEGTGYCTGALINNTANDGRPYVLSAWHCMGTFTPMYDMWRFDFNYEASGCANPATEPAPQSLLGAIERAGWSDTDMLLLEIDPVPDSYDPYFSGWDRRVPANASYLGGGTMIHHPAGDIKKIAIENNAYSPWPSVLNWDNGVPTPGNSHLRIRYDVGALEPGSSGAPVYNVDGLIVANNHGGTIGCSSVNIAYAGRFPLAWAGGGAASSRLQDWLDPLGSNPDTLHGRDDLVFAPTTISLSGKIATENNLPIPNVMLSLTGNGQNWSATTDSNGDYLFTDVPAGMDFELSLEKIAPANQGVSTQDLIRIRRHILTTVLLDSPYKIIGADVNNTESVSTIDLIRIQQVIQTVESDFGNVPIWQFLPADHTFGSNPFAGLPSAPFTITGSAGDLTGVDFVGFKTGDANLSVQP